MNQNTLLITLTSLSSILFIGLLILFIKNIKLNRKIALLSTTYSNMQRLLDFKQSDISENEVHQENFIKFLSDSRDWAFEYIESVQNGLDKFVSEVDASIAYFDDYGDVISMSRPDYDSLKVISKSYKELKQLLPTEENK